MQLLLEFDRPFWATDCLVRPIQPSPSISIIEHRLSRRPERRIRGGEASIMNDAAVFDPKGNQAMPAGPPLANFFNWLWERPLARRSGRSTPDAHLLSP